MSSAPPAPHGSVAEKIANAMADPCFYPHHPDRVEVRETHSARVFIAGDRAYKVRKPVRFAFLDYSSLSARRAAALEEVRVNADLAPGIYRGVKAIVVDDGGLRLAPMEAPGALEYAVEMRRLPEERTMSALLAANALSTHDVRRVAARMAAFHARATTVADPRAWIGTERRAIADTLRALRDSDVAGTDDGRFVAAFLRAREDWIRARADAGRVRDCHGDLRAEHVVVAEAICVFDRIEFDDRLRCTDVAADVSFLAMDLEAHGAADHARTFVDGYRGSGGDPGDDPYVAFLGAARSWVRAKVHLLRRGQQGADAEARRWADTHLALARRLCWRARGPLILAVGGVAASGKTTIARAVAAESGFTHLSSDVLRKRMAGLEPSERAPASLYSEDANRATYARLGALARAELRSGAGVIVDATFRKGDDRATFLRALEQGAGALREVRCVAPGAVLAERARRRWTEQLGASDATETVVARQLREDRAGSPDAIVLPTDRPVVEMVPTLRAELDRRLTAPAP